MLLAFDILWKFELVRLVVAKAVKQNPELAALNMTTAFGMVASKRCMSFTELCNRENADTDEEISLFIYISNTRSVTVVKTDLSDFHPP